MSGYGFPKEMYKESVYRVVHSPEEHDAMLKLGWSDIPEEGMEYRPITAVAPGPAQTPRQVLAKSAGKKSKDE